MKFRLIYLLVFSWLVPVLLFGQTDTVMIQEVEVIALSIRDQTPTPTCSKWNQTEITASPINKLGDLLNNESSVFVKSYGLNSLATSSIRGGSAGHTLVLWNGLPIQSPMLGLLDLSLLPVHGMEVITLQKGGNSALWGNGAIGGVIRLQNQPDFSQKFLLNIQSGFGQFGQFNQHLKVGVGNKKFQSITKLFHQQAENDFYYPIAENLPDRQQTNAAFSIQNMMQDFYWNVNDYNKISLHFWQQFSDRQIPPTNTQTRSEAYQKDRATRIILNWKQIKNSMLFHGRIGYFNEFIDYHDERIGLFAPTRFTTLTGEFGGQKSWNQNHHWHFGYTQSFTKAHSENYEIPPEENKFALFSSYRFVQPKWQTQLSIRQGWVSGKLIPLVPSLTINYRVWSFLNLDAKISRNYRLPTLNDQFWIPGGNPELKPESGWSQEASAFTSLRTNKLQFKYVLTGFNRKIDNWILWSLAEGQSIWTAKNLTKVHSRGFEQRATISYATRNWKIKFDLGHDFVRSSNEITLRNPNIAKGDQLIYTPKNKLFTKLNIQWKQLLFSYGHTYTGSSQGINDALSSYHVANTHLQYTFKFKNCKSIVFANIQNLWDANYFVVERRPMPGIHFEFGLNFQFTKKHI